MHRNLLAKSSMNGACSILKIAVCMNYGRAVGRQTCEGIAAFAMTRSNWRLTLVPLDASSHSLRGYDGYICGAMTSSQAKALVAFGKPVVNVTGCEVFGGTASVMVDNRMCGEIAVQHFLEHRIRTFAYFGWKDVEFSDVRRRAFEEELARKGFKCSVFESTAKSHVHLIKKDLSRLERVRDPVRVSNWLKKLPKPVGVYCANDLRAWQLVEVCRMSGLVVPREIAVLGTDNDMMACLFTSVPISSVNISSYEIGRKAAETLDALLEGDRDLPHVVLVSPKGVEVRASSETWPIEPHWLPDALNYIRRHVSEGISALDVVKSCGLSYSTVASAFREALGTTIQKEILTSRLDEAERLLETTNEPMGNVSRASGFSSHQYFCRCFIARNGVSPGEWRGRHARQGVAM